MNDEVNRKTIETLARAIDTGDRATLETLFTDDVILEWPQSRERIRGEKNRREIYARYPSFPKVEPIRIDGRADRWTLEAKFDYGDGEPYLCVFLFEMKGGRIARETAYWSKPFPAPEWRAEWVEKME